MYFGYIISKIGLLSSLTKLWFRILKGEIANYKNMAILDALHLCKSPFPSLSYTLT